MALALEGVTKVFPPDVRAVDGVDLVLEPGKIVALCGENGAGKTTLAQIAAGKLAPSAGTVRAGGTVGFVHQHFELVERLRVWENIVLGREPHAGARLDAAAARSRVRDLAAAHGLAVEPDALVESLPVGIAQRVELLRELAREPAVLILDEPTAVLAPDEIDALFATLRALADGGTAILVITHKLQEVVDHADSVTVMRAGRIVAHFPDVATTSVADIARAMVGGEIPKLAERAATTPTSRFSAHGISAGDGAHALRDVSFEVRSGEIVGLAGVEGNGQSALADALAGVLAYAGRMELDGAEMPIGDPRERIARGLRVIPQDRRREGLVLSWPIPDNLMLGDQTRAPLRRGWRLDRSAALTFARDVVARFDVRAPSLDEPVANLSGGNQQKLLAGRALAREPRFVLAYQPTRGIDVGAAALVQSRLIEARNAGCAVLLISFELDEIFALADRVLVLYRGALAGSLERDDFDRARAGALMAGLA